MRPEKQMEPFAMLRRRVFLKQAALSLVAGNFAIARALCQESLGRRNKIRAAIIGHTGKGDYGHGLDMIFNGRGNIEVVAVADPVPAGRAAAAARSKALRQYEDYRLMLEKEKPRLVCIAPRWTHQHHAMALAALDIGAHLSMEQPLTHTF